MKIILIAVCAFLGALILPGLIWPGAHAMAFQLVGINFSFSLLFAIVVGCLALGVSVKG